MTNQTIAARMSALAKSVTNGSNPSEAVETIKAEVAKIEAEVATQPAGFRLHSLKDAAGDNGRLKADFRAGSGDDYIHVIAYVPDESVVGAIGTALDTLYATV